VGLVFGIAAVGQALGPLIGGAITDWLGWRWVMWINVPLILLVMLLAHRSVQQSRDETAPRVIDSAGLVLNVQVLIATGVLSCCSCPSSPGWPA
jgi:MFS family permease